MPIFIIKAHHIKYGELKINILVSVSVGVSVGVFPVNFVRKVTHRDNRLLW